MPNWFWSACPDALTTSLQQHHHHRIAPFAAATVAVDMLLLHVWLLHSNSSSVCVAATLLFVLLAVRDAAASASASASAAGGTGPGVGTGGAAGNSANSIKYSRQTVKTKYGPLRGIVARSNPPVEAFLGVPYATPPVGSLR